MPRHEPLGQRRGNAIGEDLVDGLVEYDPRERSSIAARLALVFRLDSEPGCLPFAVDKAHQGGLWSSFFERREDLASRCTTTDFCSLVDTNLDSQGPGSASQEAETSCESGCSAERLTRSILAI